MILLDALNIQVASDLHLDRWVANGHTPHFVVEPHADILILAGDLCDGVPTGRVLAWLQALAAVQAWPQGMLLVLGNHDHYGLPLDGAAHAWRHALRATRIQMLDRDVATLPGGIRVAGCTFWTDFDRNNPLLAVQAQQQLRDYKEIRAPGGQGGLALPEHILQAHRRDLDWLVSLDQGTRSSPLVVVTHHAPTWAHVDPRRLGDPLNGAYAIEAQWAMEYLTPALWVHGHVHVNFDSQIGPTRVVCRPTGYFGEQVLNC